MQNGHHHDIPYAFVYNAVQVPRMQRICMYMYVECANQYMCDSPCTGLSSCLLVLVEHVITSFITQPSPLPDKACVCIPDFNCAVKPLFFEFQRVL